MSDIAGFNQVFGAAPSTAQQLTTTEAALADMRLENERIQQECDRKLREADQKVRALTQEQSKVEKTVKAKLLVAHRRKLNEQAADYDNRLRTLPVERTHSFYQTDYLDVNQKYVMPSAKWKGRYSLEEPEDTGDTFTKIEFRLQLPKVQTGRPHRFITAEFIALAPPLTRHKDEPFFPVDFVCMKENVDGHWKFTLECLLHDKTGSIMVESLLAGYYGSLDPMSHF